MVDFLECYATEQQCLNALQNTDFFNFRFGFVVFEKQQDAENCIVKVGKTEV